MRVSVMKRSDIIKRMPMLSLVDGSYKLTVDANHVVTIPGLNLTEEIAKFCQLFSLKSLTLNLPKEACAKLIYELADHFWTWDKYKSDQSATIDIVLATEEHFIAEVETELVVLNNVNYCKDLAISPPNLMTPEMFTQECLKLGVLDNVKVEVFDQNSLMQMGMNCVLAVGKGSSNPPFVVTVSYNGNPSKQPVALIGKGICFDAGGLFLKDQKSMPSMKYDKSGACAVLAAIKAIAELKLPVNVVGILGLAENMPGSNAMRPGDVIKSMDGLTIEIMDPDAEGRLVLADCITLGRKFNPASIVTLATLTADTAKSLGMEYAGLFTEDEQQHETLMNASKNSGDKLWRLPMGELYKNSTKSNIADLKNVSDSEYADNCTAATFLKVFAHDTPFAHIDLSLSAFKHDAKLSYALNPTGFGVRLLVSFMEGFKQ